MAVKYLIGYSDNAWDFVQAYHHASDGAIFELEPGYDIDFDDLNLILNKTITIVGSVKKREDGSNCYQNTFRGRVTCSGESTLTMKHIWFELRENIVLLSVKNKATLIIEDAFFAGVYPQNTKYLMMVEGSSKLVLNDTATKVPENTEEIQVKDNSTLEVIKSTLKVRVVVKGDSALIARKSRLEYTKSNVMTLLYSTLEADHLTVSGGNKENQYPAIRLEKSKAVIKNSHLKSPLDLSTLTLITSTAAIEQTQIGSIELLDGATASLAQPTITDRMKAVRTSYLYVSQGCILECQNTNKIPIYLEDQSAVMGDSVTFHKAFSPLIRATKNSAVLLDDMALLDGERSNIKVDFDETSRNSIKEASSKATDSVNEEEQDSYEVLQQLVGLESVKRTIDEMISRVEYNKLRIAQGNPPKTSTLHSAFLGNPGTGKTTVARLIGRILYDKGVITGKQFKFVEVDASDLLSRYVNQTSEQTKAKLEEALGGVLFIDEAYTLHKKGTNETGQEAISTIMKFMEDHRDEIMVIFAGYTKQMEEFLGADPGLRGRIGYDFNFEDYTPDQIVTMGMHQLAQEHYILADPAYYERTVKKAYQVSLDKSNARWIRSFNEKVTDKLAFRVIQEKRKDISLITNEDIDAVLSIGSYEDNGTKVDAFQALQSLIGLRQVKEQVEEFIADTVIARQREEEGYPVADKSLHSLFLGNPGTGKTTVARIIGELLYQKGIIATNKFYEVTRGDLVGGWQGQTAIQTREHLNAALGGVLFIDEAYTLKQGANDTFGQEAIDEIMKFMEDHRRDIVVILAGYSTEMQAFLKSNSGFTSRVPYTFDFEDYTSEELIQIGERELDSQGFQCDHGSYAAAVTTAYQHSYDHSNGRWIRNFNQKLRGQMSRRLLHNETADKNLITQEDLDKMITSHIGNQ